MSIVTYTRYTIFGMEMGTGGEMVGGGKSSCTRDWALRWKGSVRLGLAQAKDVAVEI